MVAPPWAGACRRCDRHAEPVAAARRRLDHRTASQDLRQNGFPWAATPAAILTAFSVLGLTARHTTRWAALVRATGLITAAALLGIAGYFTLSIEDLLATLSGTPRFLSDNEVITGIGTLTGSVLTLSSLR